MRDPEDLENDVEDLESNVKVLTEHVDQLSRHLTFLLERVEKLENRGPGEWTVPASWKGPIK